MVFTEARINQAMLVTIDKRFREIDQPEVFIGTAGQKDRIGGNPVFLDYCLDQNHAVIKR